jgi:hypothetical protein
MTNTTIERPTFVVNAIAAKESAEQNEKRRQEEETKAILQRCHALATDACQRRSPDLLQYFEPKLPWGFSCGQYNTLNVRRFLQPIPGVGPILVTVSGRKENLIGKLDGKDDDPFAESGHRDNLAVTLTYYGPNVDVSNLSKLDNYFRSDVTVNIVSAPDERWNEFWVKAAAMFDEAEQSRLRDEANKAANERRQRAGEIGNRLRYRDDAFDSVESAKEAMNQAISLDPANTDHYRASFSDWKSRFESWARMKAAWEEHGPAFIAAWQAWAVDYAKAKFTTISNLEKWAEGLGEDATHEFRLTYAAVATDDGESYLEQGDVTVLSYKPDANGFYSVVKYGNIQKVKYTNIVSIEDCGIKSWRRDLTGLCRKPYVGTYQIVLPPTIDMPIDQIEAAVKRSMLIIDLPEEPVAPPELSRRQCAACAREAIRNIVEGAAPAVEAWFKYLPISTQFDSQQSPSNHYVVETDRPIKLGASSEE